jgi:hypothetical protein
MSALVDALGSGIDGFTFFAGVEDFLNNLHDGMTDFSSPRLVPSNFLLLSDAAMIFTHSAFKKLSNENRKLSNDTIALKC